MRSRRTSEPGRRGLRVGLAALGAFIVLSCEDRPLLRDAAEAEGGGDYDVRVVDAEIMLVDGRRVRLANVDAPALVPTSRCWAEAIAARDAVLHLQAIVRQGRTVEVRLTGRQDPLGRSLAHVLIDGLDVGDALYEQALVARPAARPFRWCEPMSRETEGAPPMNPLLALTR